MGKIKVAKGVVNDYNGWNEVLQKTMAIKSYKKFFEVTSQKSAVVVKNDASIFRENKIGHCHENCRKAELEGLGLRVSGWYVMNEFTHESFASGMCRLVHHSNLLLADGSIVNITSDVEAKYQIFIQDELRDYDFENRIGYNDRLLFGDTFRVGASVPRNKVHFAAKDKFSRDVYFEKFKLYTSDDKESIQIPNNLSYKEQITWITLKTNLSLNY